MLREANPHALWTSNSTPPDLPLQRRGKGLDTYLQVANLRE